VTTDEQLMLDVQRGSREAFVELFERYRDQIWRFFRRRVSDPSRAEELSQDVFVAVLQGTARYARLAPFRSYLFGIAFNILLADRRKMSHRHVESLDDDPPGPRAVGPDLGIWVRSALAELDADDREILMLREYEQLSYDEIASLLGMPLNTVRSRLFRARMALKAILDMEPQNKVKVTHDGR
jgi:RNA polymerase sigma-70 factor (ECF subfamily)